MALQLLHGFSGKLQQHICTPLNSNHRLSKRKTAEVASHTLLIKTYALHQRPFFSKRWFSGARTELCHIFCRPYVFTFKALFFPQLFGLGVIYLFALVHGANEKRGRKYKDSWLEKKKSCAQCIFWGIVYGRPAIIQRWEKIFSGARAKIPRYM